MLIRTVFIIVLSFMFYFSPAIASESAEDKTAITVFLESLVENKFHKSTYGYAVFPTISKGGLMYPAALGGQKYSYGSIK